MTNISTLSSRLEEAELALHKLMMGQLEVSVNVGGFGQISYNQTNKKDLESYIQTLKDDLAKSFGKPQRGIIRIGF